MFVAKSPADIAPLETVLSMSGLDFLRGIIAGEIAGAAMAETMAGAIESADAGRVVFRAKPEFRHTNPAGAVHGGWYGTLLDSALGCAVMSIVPKGRLYTTLEYKINLTRALPVGMEVVCEAVVDHAGRSTAVARGDIRGAEDGKVYATGSTTCLIMAPG